ncbi:MAG: hypothetical protein WBM14_00115 [Terracidiphilus sp.]|jgi:hypothetical protein
MTRRLPLFMLLFAVLAVWPSLLQVTRVLASSQPDVKIEFRTSDRCVACHNGLKTRSGEDISIGFQWRPGMMANSARDPYWQGSVRRESIDHPESQAAIEDECSTCHMPIAHLINKSEGRKTEVFANLPPAATGKLRREAADGVSCSVCHQIEAAGLGTPETFNGNVAVATPKDNNHRLEYGPFVIDAGHQRLMQSSTGGFVPTASAHIRDSALCGSCHTLFTKALGPGGREIGSLPEQVPYLEWLHSAYAASNQSCQSCHMPQVMEAVRVTALFGQPREGMHRHEFVGGNFLMERILNAHRDELGVQALPAELSAAAERAIEFLQKQSARVTIGAAQIAGSELTFPVHVENLTGHKLPTAYPSRRAWLHVVVTAADHRVVFESGKLNPDGSIAGNANDADPTRYSPHFTRITTADQVQIFEPILGDSQGRVTTGLLTATQYLKDNRILPAGFDKTTAPRDIAVMGKAAADPDFTAGSSTTHYAISTNGAAGPFRITAELLYQPVGFRWAHNLASYPAAEPKRFVGYYESEASHSAVVLARAEATSEGRALSVGSDRTGSPTALDSLRVITSK